MKFIFLSLLVAFTLSAYAQKAKVLIVDPDIDAEELKKDYKVQKPAQHYGLPDKAIRDEVLGGIDSVAKWDELKKDIFFMDLKSKSLKELKVKYPEVSAKDFKILMDRR